MKAVVGLIGAILAAAIGGLLVIVFQAPLARHFSADRLRAEVISTPWAPLPRQGGNALDDVERDLGLLEASRLEDGEPLYLVTMNIANSGSQRVDNIRFKFQGIRPGLILVHQDGKPRRLLAQSTFELAPIPPGGSATVQVWTMSDFADLMDHPTLKLLSYSSQGPIAFEVMRYRDDTYSDPFIDFVADFVEPWVVWVFVLTALILFAALIYVWIYVAFLIADANFYRLEKKRYTANPKGFWPKHPDEARQKAILAIIENDTRQP